MERSLAMLDPILQSQLYHPHNLPAQMTSLIGREEEIVAASTLCQRADIRLLTLTGPGGSGKTRLALAVAANLLPAFSDGVFFVSLAPLREANLVLSSIAQALAIEEGTGQPLMRQLQAALQKRHLLLVLDNFEQILAAGPLMVDLLVAAPHVKMLVTSREMLHLYGEHEFIVKPLALPDHSNAPTLETIAQSASVALFVERARAVRPAFDLTHENMHAIGEICIRLGGLPLAIELAAARVKLLTPKEILARLTHRLKLLTGGAQNLPARQRTLRDTLDWSYDLLNEDEKRFFQSLGVFVGTWTLAAAQAIGQYEGEDDVLDILTSLVDKSLVQMIEAASGEIRFTLLETIREYAQEYLGRHNELADAQRRHAQFYLYVAEEAEPHLQGREQKRALQKLDKEAGQLWAALRWAIECNEAIIGLRLASALSGYLQVHSSLSEGRNWLEEILALHKGEEAPLLRAKVLYGAGVVAFRRNNLTQAYRRLQESKELAALAGEQRTQALAAAMLAELELHQGHSEAALTYAQEGMQASEEINDRWCKGILHSIFGKIESKQSNFRNACVRYHVSIVLLREAGDVRSQADVMADLAHTMHLQGRLKTAHFLYSRSLTLFEEIEDRWNQSTCLNGIGTIQRLQGSVLSAQEHFEAALALATSLGNRQERAVALTGLGQLALGQNDRKQGARFFKEGLRLTREIEHTPGIALLLAGLGELERISGMLPAAQAYYEQCLELTRKLGDKVTMVRALCGLGDIARMQQRHVQACTLLKQSVHLAWEIGDRPGLAEALEAFARCCRQIGLPERAVLFLGTTETLRDGLQIPLTPALSVSHEQELVALHEALSDAVFNEVWMYGKTIALELALSLVALIAVPERTEEKSIAPSYPASLTAREVDVLRLLATGVTDARIAEALVISPRTVNTHLRSIYGKIGVSSRSAATRFAVEHKIL
ncbi:MAG: tetratricopeptide repeat protein [Ktedonobacteraceae bacterium]|nr:tetratricopeptide repeat protein [Ktedonobacteraceae bacterium]